MTFAKTIVVGTDGSETASTAVDRAGRLAAADGARVVVVTAFLSDPEDPVIREGEQAPEDVMWQVGHRSAADAIANEARQMLRKLGANDVVIQSVAGDPGETLLGAAEQFSAELIIVGSVGLTSASRFLLGSVASTVAHHAPCDVMIVHTK